MMLERQGAGHMMGHRFDIREVLGDPAIRQRPHRVVGEADVSTDSAVRVELLPRTPNRPDGQNDDLPAARAERRMFLLRDDEFEERRRDRGG
jgi:hypothetical protein